MLENPLLAMMRQSGAPEGPKKRSKKERVARPDLHDLTGDPYDDRPRSELVDEPQERWLAESEGEVRAYIDGLDAQAREAGFGLPDWQNADGAASEYHGAPAGIPDYIKQGEYDRLMSFAHTVTPEERKALKRTREQMNALWDDYRLAHPQDSYQPQAVMAAAERVTYQMKQDGLPPDLIEKAIERDRSGFLDRVAAEVEFGEIDGPEGGADGRTVDLGSFGGAGGGSAPDEHREGPGLGSMLNDAQKRDGYL